MVDPLTLDVQLDRPDLQLVKVFASPIAHIVPVDEAKRLGAAFGTRPVGTGPFALHEWRRGHRIVFKPNPHSFQKDRVHADRIEVLVNVDVVTQMMMMERGELEIQTDISSLDLLRLQRDSRRILQVQTVPGSGPNFVVMNCELPPFTNRTVRQAMNHSVNKLAIVQALSRRAVPARGPLPMNVTGYNPDLPEYAYDPQKARALLAEAGFPNGFDTVLWVGRTIPVCMKIALMVQQNFADIGVRVELKEVDYSTLVDAVQRRRNVPMSVDFWGASFDDPKDTLDTLLNGENITDVGCMNTAFYSNQDVQALFRQASAERDSNQRIRLYQDIETRIVNDAPLIFICHQNNDHILQPWLRGYKLRPFWPSARLENVWLER